MGEAALIQLCIVVMLLVLFVLNFFFVRAVAKKVQQAGEDEQQRRAAQQDSKQEQDDDDNLMILPTLVSSASSSSSSTKNDDTNTAIEMTTTSSSFPSLSAAVKQEQGPGRGRSSSWQRISNTTSSIAMQSQLHSLLYGMALDTVYREYNLVHEFPGWKRKWAATLSTVCLVVGSSWILSPQSSLLLVRMTSTFSNTTTTSMMTTTNATTAKLQQEHWSSSAIEESPPTTATDFCSDTVSRNNDTMISFHQTLQETTNLESARAQVSRMVALFQSLQDDVTLFGEPGYACADVGGNNNTTTGDTTVVPGTKAQYMAGNWPTTNGPFFPGYCQAALTKSIELAAAQQCERRVCAEVKRFGITWAEKCVMVVEACPAASADDIRQALQDYESTQQYIVNEKIANQSAIDFAKDFAADGADEMYERAARLLSKVLRQVNVAGTIYTVYACISLLLPAPIVLFRSPMRVELYRFLFGVNRYQFVALVVILWWAVEYSTVAWYSPKLRLFALNMMRDPCFVDGDFVKARHDALTDVCDEMLTLVNNFTRLDRAINHTLAQAEIFVETCADQCGGFPNVNLASLQAATNATDVDRYQTLGFTHQLVFASTLDRVLFPSNEGQFEFVGNITVCSDPVEAQRLILSTTSDTTVNYWELWVASGLVASILIKFVVANFGLSLYFVADPLARCGGRFEYPPGIQGSNAAFQSLRDQAWTSLWATSIKWSFWWFSLTLSCVVSLYTAAEQQRSATTTGGEVSHTAKTIVLTGAVLCFLYACLIVCIRLDKSVWIRYLITCGKRVKEERTLPRISDVPMKE
jgi:hypothetical protein